MTVIQPVSYLHNRTDHTAQTDRLAISAILGSAGTALSWRQGVRNLLDLKVSAQGTPNMTVAIAGGQAFIRQATAAHGLYVLTNDASENVSIAAAHATLARKDLVIARVVDQFFSGVDNLGSLEVVTGTAASSPSDPSVSGNYVILARINVAAAATSITNAMIEDLRPIVAANGGIVPVLTTTERDALVAYRGLVVDNAQTGNLERHNGTTWQTITTSASISWTDYTPTLTGVTGTINFAKWLQMGKLVFVDFRITVTGDTNTDISVSLPVTPLANFGISGVGAIIAQQGSSLKRRGATAYIDTDNEISFVEDGLSGSNASNGKWNTSADIPWAWVSGDMFAGMIQYRVA